ncbi:MAG: type VII secretion integral membrane protein EccD [Dermatophilaceae bacterium]
MATDTAIAVDEPAGAPSPTGTVAHPRRVTVVTPQTRVDLALPLQATIAEVVLQVVSLVGSDEADPEAAAGGWLLSRLGDRPFVSGRSVGATDIADGDVLYLARRSDRLPPVLFDDVVDAVAEATSTRPDGWTVAASRRTAVGVAGALVLAGNVAVATAGAPWTAAIAVAITTAAVLVVAGAALSRAVGDSLVGAVTAMGAMPLVCWAGARAGSESASLLPTGSTALLVGGAALACTAVVAALAVGDLLPAFVGVGVTGVAGAAVGFVGTVWGASALGLAATTAVLATLAVPVFPMLSVRLARMPSPTIPVDMDEFRRDETVTRADDMVAVARQTQGMLSAFILALVSVLVPCLVVLLVDGERWSLVLAVTLALATALRARQLLGAVPRVALLVTGLACLAGVAAVVLAGAGPEWRVAAAPITTSAAAALVLYASRLPRAGAAPYTGRLLDILEFISLAALLPLLGVVLGVYARARGIAG